MEALFTQKGWGLLWLLRRLLGCSRAQRSPTRLGLILVAAEDTRLFPRKAQSYKSWGCRRGRWYRVVQVVNIVGMMNVET
jgi:hypothetical protein